MNIFSEISTLIELVAQYGRTGMLFCIFVQFVSIYIGYFFKLPTLQRMAISITSGFSAFYVGTQVTDAVYLLCVFFFATFYTTYALTPKFVGEEKGSITVNLGGDRRL